MKFLWQIWMILTLNCEDSARLTSESMDRSLNWAERWAVRLHRFICSKSRRLNRQLLDMNRALQRTNAFDSASGRMDGLSEDARNRIRMALKQDPDKDQ